VTAPRPEPEGAALAAHWLEALRTPEVRTELDAIYDYVMAAIDARRPLCTASGRCCNFEAYGHRLYVTGLETAYTIARLGAPLTRDALADARVRGGCPFQSGTLCSVHDIKPLACRVYFCDATAQDWMHETSERMLKELRALHRRHGLEYRYGEWRGLLELFL
jgi:Fe-S-cluster containining protein